MKLSVITPIRDRPSTTALAARWMARQTLADVEWIVVDDGDTPCNLSVPGYFYRGPSGEGYTNAANVLEGMSRATGDALMYLEDDDWAPANYLSVLVRRLDRVDVDVVVSSGLRQYHVGFKSYIDKRHDGSFRSGRASFCVTGAGVETLREVCEACASSGDPFIDLEFWKRADGSLRVCVEPRDGLVQMKGFPGRFITEKHVKFNGRLDPKLEVLKEWVGAEDCRVILEAYDGVR